MTMRVIVIFEFEGVKPNSRKADRIVQSITDSCETMQVGFDAQACWVDDAVEVEAVEDGPVDWPTAEVIDKALDSGFIGTEESEKFLQQLKERKVQS